jgi:hypothetical protein
MASASVPFANGLSMSCLVRCRTADCMLAVPKAHILPRLMSTVSNDCVHKTCIVVIRSLEASCCRACHGYSHAIEQRGEKAEGRRQKAGARGGWQSEPSPAPLQPQNRVPEGCVIRRNPSKPTSVQGKTARAGLSCKRPDRRCICHSRHYFVVNRRTPPPALAIRLLDLTCLGS